jgi:hypothetical protein
MKKFLIVLLIMSGLILASEEKIMSELASELEIIIRDDIEVSQEKIDKLDAPVIVNVENKWTKPIGEPINWGLENYIKTEGWQLSGWSKVGLDKDFNRWRFKIGIISEMEAVRKMDIDVDRNLRVIQDWERQVNKGPVFGIFFIKEF